MYSSDELPTKTLIAQMTSEEEGGMLWNFEDVSPPGAFKLIDIVDPDAD